jgi:hypothetical protein
MATLIEKTHVLPTPYDSVRFQLYLYVFVNDFPLSKGEINALALFYMHGINDKAIDLIINSKIYKNRQSVENLISKLVKLKVLKKTGKKQKEFTDEIPVKVDTQILMNIKIGNR